MSVISATSSSPVLSMLEEIVRMAREAGASDIHLAVGLSPRMRVNGRLVTMSGSRITSSDTLDILLQVMTEAQRVGFEEKGEYDFSFSISDGGRCRANAYKQKGSVALALHLVDTEIPSPEELGMPEAVAKLHERESGLVLVTGPSGSGRSATMAAMVEQMNADREAMIITLEDPIEYIHQSHKAMIQQREIGLDSRSYAEALRAALREDPDVILVGELRDAETVSAAVTAAEAGHLVLSALPAANVINAVDAVFDFFPQNRQESLRRRLADVLEAVVAQRLLPAGGDRRAAAFEVLLNNPVVRDLLRKGKTAELIQAMQSGEAQGMLTMDDSISRLYEAGKIDKSTAIRYMQVPDMLE